MNNYIKKLRLEAGINRPELAERSGVPKRTIDDWENGRREPRDVYQLKKIADVLGVNLEDLIDWDSDSSENSKNKK